MYILHHIIVKLVFSPHKQTKNIDLSFKMDLDFWVSLGRVNNNMYDLHT